MDARTQQRWSLVRDHQEGLLAEARSERLAREGRTAATSRGVSRLVGGVTAWRRAAALHIRTPARPPRPLASYAGDACHEAGVAGTLNLITLADGRRVLACQPALETT
jgi:hypothetical protein